MNGANEAVECHHSVEPVTWALSDAFLAMVFWS
jgi:hypothetical protein